MSEGTFEALLAVGMTLMCIGLAYAIHKMEKNREEAINRAEKLRDDIGAGLTGMVSALDIDVPDIHSIREIIEESLHGVMGDMHVPTGQDMMLGAISQFVMSKITPQIPQGIQNLAESVLPPAIQPQESPESP